jgi:ankyrin repeat protein
MVLLARASVTHSCFFWQARNARRLAFPPDVLPTASSSAVPSSHVFPSSQLLSHQSILASTSDIVKSVVSSDVPSLHKLLFPPHDPALPATPPYLVNRGDKDEWSPLHYCCSIRHPNIEVLDALFLAGADVNLLTQAGDCTPLHCLARKRRGDDALRDAHMNRQLYAFVEHLVRDLGAPLAAQNAARDTCIHVAAEHGDSAEVLRALLDCDVDRTVREMKNSRG